ncbi:MAG: hypothetical protein M0P31_13590 [Solirubrobacteraceae bacterium]|nr:hypothetical protein [Solirubrobacteraceae bacterium]
MGWAKIDDQLHGDRKVRRLWHTEPAALGLWTLALSHCANQETDGHIDDLWVLERVPDDEMRERLVTALVSVGLWDERDGSDGWWIHDYLDYNPSRAELVAKRRADAERKAAGRAEQARRRAERATVSGGSPTGVREASDAPPPGPAADSAKRPRRVRADTARTPQGVAAESSGPDPTRPDPSRPTVASPPPPAREREAAPPAPTADPPRPTAAVLDCPEPVRAMLLDAGFDQGEIDHADGALGYTLGQLNLPPDVDWWRYGQEIATARQNGRLRRPGPIAALKFVAKGANGPPRLRPGQNGRRTGSTVDHYRDMAARFADEERTDAAA